MSEHLVVPVESLPALISKEERVISMLGQVARLQMEGVSRTEQYGSAYIQAQSGIDCYRVNLLDSSGQAVQSVTIPKSTIDILM